MSDRLSPINPESLATPRGYSHGMKGNGDLVFVAGQIGWDRHGHMVPGDFVAQFAQALDNVLEVVWKAGGGPHSVARPIDLLNTAEGAAQVSTILARMQSGAYS